MTDHQFSGFDHSITDDDIRTKNIRGRIYRNRRIGDFLRELGLIEGRNTGFPNARKALRQNGSPDLEFEMDPSRQYLSVIIPVHKAFLDPKASKGNAYQEKILKTHRLQNQSEFRKDWANLSFHTAWHKDRAASPSVLSRSF